MTEDKPVSLLERARIAQTAKSSKCSMAKLLATHPNIGLEELLANCGDSGEGIPYSVAAAVVSEAVGQKIEGQTISRHNRRRCTCS